MYKFALLVLLVACGSTPKPQPQPQPKPVVTDSRCTAPQAWFKAGCGGTFSEGCYTSCDPGTCPAGTTCTKVMKDPGEVLGGTADVCAVEAHLCM